MLGWHISVYRVGSHGNAPATLRTRTGHRLAVWQGGPEALDWLNALVAAGEAQNLGGDGYPLCYTAQAKHITRRLVDDPPEARDQWLHDPGDIITDRWIGHTLIDRAAIAKCPPGEWLLIEAWDES